MRKYLALAPVLGMLLLASCKEKAPLINFTDIVPEQGDTTYVLSSVPAAQPRNVFIEEFTGVSCPNCPQGHAFIKSLLAAHPGRVVSVGLYMENLLLTDPVNDPPHLTKDDFRSPIANNVNATIYDGTANGLPIAGIDRVKYSGVRLLDRALWTATVESRLAVASPLNLEATSDYNATDSSLKVKLTATFNAQVTQTVYFAIGIVQDSIVDVQEQGLAKIDDYQHDHVFRGYITAQGVNGIQLPFSTFYETGRVFVRTVNVPLFQTLRAQAPLLNSTYIKPEHCKVFAFAYYMNGDAREVLQATEIDML